MVYLDANVLVFAALDEGELGDAARHILANLAKIGAKTCCLSLDELAWAVLRRSDHRTAAEACRTLGLRDLNIVSAEFEDMWEMTREMETFRLRPRDALHLAVMRRLGERSIVSEDPHFEMAKVKGIPIRTFAKSI